MYVLTRYVIPYILGVIVVGIGYARWWRGLGRQPSGRDTELLGLWLGVAAISWPIGLICTFVYHLCSRVLDAIDDAVAVLQPRREARLIARCMKADEAWLRKVGGQVTTDEYGDLWTVSFRDRRQLSFVDLKDSTTGKPVRFRVPQRSLSTQDAIAWSFGIEDEYDQRGRHVKEGTLYQPLVQT